MSPGTDESAGDADFLTSLFVRADRIFLKKLSNNDRDWARLANKHQAGVYIPAEHRDGGFFPPLEAKERKPGADEIRETFFRTIWPQNGGEERRSRVVHYTSKGAETHLTGLPKEVFASLLPASFLVIGRLGPTAYECLTVDSGSDEVELLAGLFDISADFLAGEFLPDELRANERDRVLSFAERVVAAWLDGTIAAFAKEGAAMPPTIELARQAQAAFLAKYGLAKIDPFALPRPGDALREISRIIEWDIFRDYQRKERSVDLVRIVLGDTPHTVTGKDVILQLIDRLPEIDALMLSASQQRKSRAGYSYEHHIEAMLTGGNIPFEKQVILETKKRPDFVLPSLVFVDGNKKAANTGLILSAKTTLRERWKQVEREKGNRRLFLTTVDENVAGTAIEDMAAIGVHLVIPESLRESKATEYQGHANVVSFAELCRDHIRPHLASWLT